MRERFRRGVEALIWFAPALVALNFLYRDLRHPRLRDVSMPLTTQWDRMFDRCVEYAGDSERLWLALFLLAMLTAIVATVCLALAPQGPRLNNE
jgi:hypothetical protein